MPTPTKVILAILGLLIGILVVYYGFMMPKPHSTETAASGEGIQEAGGVETSNLQPTLVDHDSSSEGVDSAIVQNQTSSPVSVDDGTTRPTGMFSVPLSSGGLEDVYSTLSNSMPSVTMGASSSTVTANVTSSFPVSVSATHNPQAVQDPLQESQSAKVEIPVDYTIREGDTLMSISTRWLGDAYQWEQIAQVNPGLDPRRLRIGQRIKLPSRDSLLTAAPDMKPRQSFIYAVKAGDTLSGLAQRYYGNGKIWERIFTANRLTLGGDANALRVGMKLVIPPSPY